MEAIDNGTLVRPAKVRFDGELYVEWSKAEIEQAMTPDQHFRQK